MPGNARLAHLTGDNSMSTTRRRTERQQLNPDLAVLAARLSRSIQRELFDRMRVEGHGDLSPQHGAILPFLDEDGVRATELARLSGRHKQVVGRLVDEMEELGYVVRRPDPADRRAKLVVPTDRGLEQMRLADRIVAEIETRHADRAGRRDYLEFRNVLRAVAGSPPPA